MSEVKSRAPFPPRRVDNQDVGVGLVTTYRLVQTLIDIAGSPQELPRVEVATYVNSR